jgi:uncharacterized integral membrane protein
MVGLFLFAVVGITALGILFTTDTTNWPTGVGLIGTFVVGILACVAIAVSFIPKGRGL